ncbi:GPR1/FUN34/yaaH family-domain-containing protein [Suillus subluteus]|nr:GPR1/FUN34/yaaH family-domain-containing protein [Suillus subluteus]
MLSSSSIVTFSNSKQVPNPAALGLFSFASTTFILSLYNVNAHGVILPNVVVGMACFCGGLAQLLAGMDLCAHRWLKQPKANGTADEFCVYYGNLNEEQRKDYDNVANDNATRRPIQPHPPAPSLLHDAIFAFRHRQAARFSIAHSLAAPPIRLEAAKILQSRHIQYAAQHLIKFPRPFADHEPDQDRKSLPTTLLYLPAHC